MPFATLLSEGLGEVVCPYMRVCARRIGVVREADWELSPGRVEGGFKGGFKAVYPRRGEFGGDF